VSEEAVEVLEEVALGFEVLGLQRRTFGLDGTVDRPRFGDTHEDADAAADGDRPARPGDGDPRVDGDDRHEREVDREEADRPTGGPRPDPGVASGAEVAPFEPVAGVSEQDDERYGREQADEELVREDGRGVRPSDSEGTEEGLTGGDEREGDCEPQEVPGGTVVRR
jgi:hypothetical protein